MKNLYILTTAFLLILSASCDSTTETVSKDEWLTIETEEYSLQHPKEWKQEKQQQMGTEFMLMTSRTSALDEFKENINLVVQDISNTNLDLEKYTAISEEQIMEGMENAEMISSERTKKHGETAQQIIYTASYGKRKLKFEQYYWIKNSKAFILTMTCEADQFDTYKKVGEEILESFRLK
ncbi:MAG: PsbP-related protein [Bacteroidota bacterium]